MAGNPKTSVAIHRARRQRQGFVRVEVSVRQEDAGLVRHIAAALSDPLREAEMRSLLQQGLAETPRASLKALLASAPLDGIELDRSADPGRPVDL